MKAEELQETILELWGIVKKLEDNYKEDNRKFTVDGHLLGSIGEVYAKEKFNLKLLGNSEKCHDAINELTNEKYQIKITQRNKVGLRYEPDNLIVIKIEETGIPIITYNGCGKLVWESIKHKKSKQKFISINQLKNLKKNV
ncbi:hypothetical protein ERX46_06180 [Brumimicrobium glaciale]|uniref:DUF6998 domain-containing protein n=1 Tax=Brumimicrobium glaciale TaxID=200475 RepID=A0A4Q4KP91_9FLAO|nr:hypothetical protein [Brumimicrobium glaciale]RYM34958.1 hypothetical protein ERX46_06180 [Brumimicrobium glaciale]